MLFNFGFLKEEPQAIIDALLPRLRVSSACVVHVCLSDRRTYACKSKYFLSLSSTNGVAWFYFFSAVVTFLVQF